MKGAARLQASARLRQRPPSVRGRILRNLEGARLANQLLADDTVHQGSDGPGSEADHADLTPTPTIGVVQPPLQMQNRAMPSSPMQGNTRTSGQEIQIDVGAVRGRGRARGHRAARGEGGEIGTSQAAQDSAHLTGALTAPRGRGRGRGCGRASVRTVAPPDWVPPAIVPTARTPPRLRNRGITRLAPSPTVCSPQSVGTASPATNIGPSQRRPRLGRGPQSIGDHRDGALLGTGSKSLVVVEEAHPQIAQGLGRRGQSVACNLNNTFTNAGLVHDWLDAVVSLAEVEEPLVSTPLIDTLVNPHEHHHQDRPCSSLIPCVPGVRNGPNGMVLPNHVWVPLRILGFDPTQWGGLQTFLGDVQQAWWEHTVQFYGVDFGGGIGWRKVAVADCHSMDWRAERSPPYTRPGPSTPAEMEASAPHDGSILREGGHHSPSEDSVSLDSRSVEYPIQSIGTPRCSSHGLAVGADVTPRPSSCRNDDVANTPALSYLDGWTEDSEDPNWMASFHDFTGNLSDDENSDWELLDDRSTRLSNADGLDAYRYREFVETEGLNPEPVGSVRERYADEF